MSPDPTSPGGPGSEGSQPGDAQPKDGQPKDGQPKDAQPKDGQPRSSKLPDEHWSRARSDRNQDTIDFLRERSRAPGVEGGGAARNHYCMECNGVIPLLYDRRLAHDDRKLTHCPHCGAELDERVQAMFNWVEIDQVSGSDARAMLPFVGLALLLLGALVWGLIALFT
ncbi:MAG: hypothetical protein ACYSWX_12190 [Planctomycetota bacterium]